MSRERNGDLSVNSDEIRGHGKEFLTYRLLLFYIIYLFIYQNLHDNFLTGLNKNNSRKVAYKTGSRVQLDENFDCYLAIE